MAQAQAKVTYDSELMLQHLPAETIPEANHFDVVYDENWNPMIFSIGSDGVFYLIKRGTDNKNRLINLTQKFGLSDSGKTVAFAATQDFDKKTYLLFAEELSSGDRKMYVLDPKKPEEIDWAGSNDLKIHLLNGDSGSIHVREFFLGNGNDNKGFPLAVVVFDDVVRSTVDINRIEVNDTGTQKTWSLKSDLNFDYNPTLITSMCVGNLVDGRGLFTLSEIQGKQHLKFIGVANEFGLQSDTELVVPPGAKSLASFTNSSENGKYTDLLVGGDGLFHFSSKDASSSWSKGRELTSNNSYFQGMQEIYVAETENGMLSIWGENGDNEIVYMQMNIDTTVVTSPVPLLTRKQNGGRFAAIMDPISHSQQLFVHGDSDNKNITLLQQSSDTRLWKTSPILIPSINKNFDAPSFTSHINIIGSDGKISVYKNFTLRSSGWADLIVNGKPMIIGTDGEIVTADSRGNITIIGLVTDISSHVFTLQDAPNSTILNGQSYIIDPASKLRSGLGEIKSVDDLDNATTKKGKKVMEGSTASHEDRIKAVDALSKLSDHLKTLPKDGSAINSRTTARTLSRDLSIMAIDLTDPLDIINVYEDTAWDFFLFAKSKFEEAFDILKKWTVEIVDGIPHFAITVGKMVFTFILNAVENVFKAISFILEKVLGIDIMKIIEWLGYIFEWDDILETHNLIISATNIFMDMGIKSVDKVIGVVDDYFIQLEKTWTDIAIPPDLKDAKANSGLDAENKPNLNSPGGNWSGYLIEHGGVMEFKGDDTNVATIWNEVIKSTMDEMSTLASNLPTEFFQLFNEDSSISDVLDHLRAKVNILSVIKLLHKMVIEILKFFANILKNLKDLLNAKIDIPVLSALYKKINNNADLTLLDAFALLVAIPATIIYKVFSGGTTIKTDNLPFLKKSLDKFFPSEFAVVSLPVVSSDVAMDDSAEEIRKKSLAAEILPFSCITTVTYSLGSLCEIMTLSEEIILKEDEEESDRLKNVKLLMSFSSVFGLLFGIPSVFCSEPKVTGYALANLLISGWYPVVRAYIPVDIKAKGFCDFVVGIFLVSIQFYIALVEAEEDKVKDATSRGAFMEFLELLTDFIAKCSFAACKIGGMNEIPYYAGCGTSFFSVLFCIMRLSFNFEDERRHTTINP